MMRDFTSKSTKTDKQKSWEQLEKKIGDIFNIKDIDFRAVQEAMKHGCIDPKTLAKIESKGLVNVYPKTMNRNLCPGFIGYAAGRTSIEDVMLEALKHYDSLLQNPNNPKPQVKFYWHLLFTAKQPAAFERIWAPIFLKRLSGRPKDVVIFVLIKDDGYEILPYFSGKTDVQLKQ